jgi:hypothetical protein
MLPLIWYRYRLIGANFRFRLQMGLFFISAKLTDDALSKSRACRIHWMPFWAARKNPSDHRRNKSSFLVSVTAKNHQRTTTGNSLNSME